MTNETIIFNAACELLKQGILKPSGRLLMRKMPDGSLLEVPEPETIHTYAGWKARGYQVRKGEHAVAAFPIWKYFGKQDEETGEGEAPTTASGGNFVGAEVARNRAEAAVTPPRQLRARKDGHCFSKMSHFFTAAQVERVS